MEQTGTAAGVWPPLRGRVVRFGCLVQPAIVTVNARHARSAW